MIWIRACPRLRRPGGTVDAPRIGAAHDDFARKPDAWREFGTRSEIRTCFRRLWHALVLQGRPAEPSEEFSGG